MNPHADRASTPEARFRLRIRQGDVIAIGPGKISLLEAIQVHGSISAAARSMGMSYRRAWVLIDELNHALTSPATSSEHGGQRGGGSALTPVGDDLIRLYRAIERQAFAACAADIGTLTAMLRTHDADA
jgi:molybdate transport system regulatory protein